ncbi:putative protein-lysine deacylase ABHD14B [Argopecten irradians]|uniref:putative protein-lysine deacylase ABHD14B n=1 Tax=Argopecten irradians TaxID=31199 RepID=UPI00371D261F
MSPSGIQLNKTAVVVILLLCGGLALVYRFYWNKAPLQPVQKAMESQHKGWFTSMMTVPDEVKEAAKSTEVVKRMVNVTFDGKEMTICTREPRLQDTPHGDVLLLHGQAFTSATWENLCPTLQFLGAAGYRAVAIDLPNYGESTKIDVEGGKRGAFIGALIKQLKLTTPVIVSPSMSGTFSLPFLFDEPDTTPLRAKGYVPVAPVNTGSYKTQLGISKIPTAIVTGDQDTTIGPSARANLADLSNSHDFLLKDAKHPAYLDDKETWHAILYTFLKTVYQ